MIHKLKGLENVQDLYLLIKDFLFSHQVILSHVSGSIF